MSGDGPRWRGVLLVVVGAAVSLAFALVTLGLGDATWGPSSPGADAYSESAVGHKPFVEFLRELGIPVLVSREQTADRAGASALLVVAEPHGARLGEDGARGRYDPSGADRLPDLVDHGGPVLVVLPKRDAQRSDARQGWVEEARPGPKSEPNRVLAALGLRTRAVRADGAIARWTQAEGDPLLEIPAPVQLMEGGGIDPWVACDAGVLLGSLPGRGPRPPVAILSDPDVIAAHGLHRSGNAQWIARVVSGLLPEGGTVVFDEQVHGFATRRTLWMDLLSWPLVLTVVAALAAALVAVWAGSGRFGAPRREAPPIAAGKRALVENTADLLRLGGHDAFALDRYLEMAVQDAMRASHAPPSMPKAEARAWLEHAGRMRGARRALEDIESLVASARRGGEGRDLLRAAMAVHAWRREMTDGPSDRS